MNTTPTVTAMKWLVYAALCTPLLFSVYFFPSHAAPQTFLFRLIVEAMVVVFVFLALKKVARIESSGVAWAFGAFLAVSVLSAELGNDPWHSFFSDFERHWGVVTLAHLFAFFFMLQSAFRDEASWRRFFAVSVGASIVSACVGLWQFFFGPEELGRIYGTVGNASFFGTYLALNAVLAVRLWLERPAAWWWGAAAGFTACLSLLTGTRGVALALAAGIVLFAVTYLLSREKGAKPSEPGNKRKLLGGLAALVMLVGAGAWWLAGTDIFARSSTITTRLLAWEWGMKGFWDHPALGEGPELFSPVFNRNFKPEYYAVETAETVFDRAHNIFVEQLATTGALGLLAYGAVFIALLAAGWRAGGGRRVFAWTFAGVYGTQGLFGVDTFTSWLPMALVLAYFAGRPWEPAEKGKTRAGSGMFAVPVVLAAMAMGFVAWTVNIQPLKANMLLSDADALHKDLAERDAQTAIPEAVAIYTAALETKSYGHDTVRNSLMGFTLNAVALFGRDGPGIKDSLVPFALQEAKNNVREYPYDYFMRYRLAQVYNISYLFSRTSDAEIEKMIADGAALAPGRLELSIASAQLALVKNDIDEAVRIAQNGVKESEGRLTTFYRILFLAYSIKGDADATFAALDEGVAHGLALQNEREAAWLEAQYVDRGLPEKAQALRERFPSLFP